MKLFSHNILRICIVMAMATALLSSMPAHADNNSAWESYLQELFENSDNGAEEFEKAYQQLTELQSAPLDINTAEVAELLQIPGLDFEIINDIIEYREKYGRLHSITELALIPSIDNRLRDFLACFLIVAGNDQKPWYCKDEIKKSLRYIKHTAILSASIPTYYRAGDTGMASVKGNKYAGAYLGDPLKHSLRYNMKLGRHAALNFTGGKTAGEPFGCNGNSMGYDTYSFNVSANRIGHLNRIIIGHFRRQFGMGLTVNNSFSLGKQAMLASIGRLTNAFTPHSSTSDGKHFRGIAATIDLTQRFQLSAFASCRYVDATLNSDSSVSTLLSSPQHRTRNEMAKKNNTMQSDFGLHLRHTAPLTSKVQWQVGASFTYTAFNRTLNPTFSKTGTVSDSRLYRLYLPHGSHFFNASVDYSLRRRSITICGETAINDNGALASINTALWQALPTLTLSAAQRYYAYRYHTLNGSSFSSGGNVQNESGLYLAAKYTQIKHIAIEAYTDIAYYPWLKYQISSASYSWDNCITATYAKNAWNLALRYRANSRQRDISTGSRKQLAWRTDQRLRLTIARQTDRLTLRTQVEGCLLTFDENSKGIILTQQATYALNRKWSTYAMGAYFHTDDYDSRIYTYERGPLHNFGYSAYYGHGMRLALMLRTDISEHLMATAKVGHTHYFDRKAIGTAERTIYSNHQTDIDLQLRLKL